MTNKSRPEGLTTEQRIQLLVNAVTDYAIYMLDTEGHVATWNAGARRFKGYEADEIIGQHFSKFFTEQDLDAGLPQAILRTAAEEGRYEGEGRRIRKDGSEIWVHVVVDPIRDDQGELLGFAKVTRDITERRQAEDALHASEQRFRILVQGVRDYAIYMLDADGYVSNWNSGAEAIKGYAAEEIVGQHFSRFYTEEDRVRGEPAFSLETAMREGRYEKEAQRVRKDGSRFWAHIVIDPIYENGALVGFAKVTRDITDKKRAQDDLEEARTALFQSQKLQALGELTGGIAHDFNNLMTVIRGSAELLQQQNLGPEKQDRHIKAIIEMADRATLLTGRLLAFARRKPLNPEVVELGVRLDAFGEVMSRTLGSKIDITVELAPGLWAIEVDPAELDNALLNAAVNARDAMPDGGRLTISASNLVKENSVCITLADTGEGIPPDVLSRVFEPFFTTKPEGKGTGLGLSQIHGFAAQAGGHADIQSVPGEGTTIRLFLPRTTKVAEIQNRETTIPATWNSLDVLLIEDNDHVRCFARTLLEELRCTVTEAESADPATRLLQDRRFDLIFSDIVMPGMSGLQLARSLRESLPSQPILLATGYSKEVANGEAEGFQIVQKPYGAESLTTAISMALAARSFREHLVGE